MDKMNEHCNINGTVKGSIEQMRGSAALYGYGVLHVLVGVVCVFGHMVWPAASSAPASKALPVTMDSGLMREHFASPDQLLHCDAV